MGLLNALILFSAIFFVGAVASVAFTTLNFISSIKVGDFRHQVLGDTIELSMPVNLTNDGILPISDVLIKLRISDTGGVITFEGESQRITILPRESKTLLVNVRMNFSQMSAESISFIMSRDMDLVMTATVQAAIHPFAKASLAVNGTNKWGPPYSDLRIGEPVVEAYNTTHLSVKIPISFKNRSGFSFGGYASIFIMDGPKYVGYGKTFFDIKPMKEFVGILDLKLEIPWADISDPELLTKSLQKNYNITIRLPAPFVNEFSIHLNETKEWGAPISDLSLPRPSVTVYNDTHVKVVAPLTFIDKSVMVIEGTIQSEFYDLAGNMIGKSLELPFRVEPDQRYSGEIIGYLPKAALNQPVRMEIKLKTPYGVVGRSVEIGV